MVRVSSIAWSPNSTGREYSRATSAAACISLSNSARSSEPCGQQASHPNRRDPNPNLRLQASHPYPRDPNPNLRLQASHPYPRDSNPNLRLQASHPHRRDSNPNLRLQGERAVPTRRARLDDARTEPPRGGLHVRS